MPTKIEWTDETWNPVTGCTKISAGCQNCYAERMAKRLRGRFGYPADDPFRVTLHADRLGQPHKWRKPRMVFVCSMGDLFHEDVPDIEISNVFTIMKRARNHTFQVLTKRPERMCDWVNRTGEVAKFTWPLPNVWLGVTVENQRIANERVPLLLQTPAAVRFVSVEPMLEPVDLLNGRITTEPHHITGQRVSFSWLDMAWGLDWVICGGETGPGARPTHPDWARSLRDQCKEQYVPFFFKQMTQKEQIPPDLMIREYPKV